MSKYKLLIFDMGGTIVKPVLLNKCLNMTFLTDCINESLTYEQIDTITNFFNRLRNEIHANHDRKFEISIKNLLEITINRFNLTPRKTLDEIEQLVVFGNTNFYQPDESDKLLDYVIQSATQICVLSNSEVSSQLLLQILDKLYPLVNFSKVYSSADLMYRKPSTEMLKKILEDFNLIPEECCIIGNGEEDIMVANSFGMNCFLVGDKKISKDLKYNSILNLNDLLQYIK